MGQWTDCRECRGDCSPGPDLTRVLDQFVKDSPKSWRFEVLVEDEHTCLRYGNPEAPGSWVVGIYKDTDAPVMLEFQLWARGGTHFGVMLKAEHKRCPFSETETKFAEQLHLLRKEFLDYWPNFFGNNWKKSQNRSDAKGSTQVAQFPEQWNPGIPEDGFDGFSRVKKELLEAMLQIDERGWTANP